MYYVVRRRQVGLLFWDKMNPNGRGHSEVSRYQLLNFCAISVGRTTNGHLRYVFMLQLFIVAYVQKNCKHRSMFVDFGIVYNKVEFEYNFGS